MTAPTIERLMAILPEICDHATSSDPQWSEENRMSGQCANVGLIVQQLFGGDLLRIDLTGTPFAGLRSHYWNRLPDGREVDLTRSQFGDAFPADAVPIIRERNYVLSPKFPDTVKRWELLTWRLAQELHADSPLFTQDREYFECFMAALKSPCQKMRFGCVIAHEGAIVHAGSNATIGPLASLCEGRCIRFDIQSRTESMLGACGHAEEGMWAVVKKGIPLTECELYVAGLHMNGLPWLKTAPEHTCLRCSVQMHNAGLRAIHVPMAGGWARITTEQALASAKAYATKEKSV